MNIEAQLVRDRIAETTKERDVFVAQANAELNHKIGEYNGRILELGWTLRELEGKNVPVEKEPAAEEDG